MGVEFEAQTAKEHQDIKTREIQQENMEKLDNVTDLVNNISFDNIERDTKTIKNIVVDNLENQTNIDDVSETLEKVVQGIADIKRGQTNINKKIKEIQDQIGE